MSEPLRIAMVVEGPTDFIVLDAVVSSLLPDRDIEFQSLQPEFSATFQVQPGPTGLGWPGVYRWCRQAASEGQGRVSGSSLFTFHQILVVQVDADVAGMTYQSGRIDDQTGDLPCEKPCPPSSATTDTLRKVVLRWLGEYDVPVRCVLCTPSKSMETWVLAALFPANKEVVKRRWECHANPESQFATLPKAGRIRKVPDDYRSKRQDIVSAWPNVRAKLVEAQRFSTEMLKQVELLRK